MKEIVGIYKKQFLFIESSLTSMIESVDLTQYDSMAKKSIFTLLPAVKATYKISKELKQSTPLYTEDKIYNDSIGTDKSHLLERIQFRDDGIYISNIYVNSRSGTPYITLVAEIDKEYVVFDFELYSLLKELSLIEGHEKFGVFVKYFYMLFGTLLTFFSLALIAYAVYNIWIVATEVASDLLSGLFRSIIALTLALAIFDLSKTILEHEVFYKSLSRSNNLENRLLARFITSIIIALSIESLMVVFKIALSDYSEMIHAFYLICGVGIMIVSLSLLLFIMRYNGKKT